MYEELGKITRATFGFGGYQDAQIGLTILLGGPGWGTQDFNGTWSHKRPDGAEWTEESRRIILGDAVMKLAELLREAGVSDVQALVGVPVKATFNNRNRLVSWRILKEVI